jgi:hypothetical protein
VGERYDGSEAGLGEEALGEVRECERALGERALGERALAESIDRSVCVCVSERESDRAVVIAPVYFECETAGRVWLGSSDGKENIVVVG